MLSWVLLTPLLASCLALPNRNNIWARPDQADKYMLGEQFFKHEGPDPGFSVHGDLEELDELPYSVVKDYGTYERRHYPAAKMVCTYDMVDTAADPLAGLEKANPWVLMQSKRSRKTPNSIMFMRLFRYISGVNQGQEEVAMTRPVVDLHKVIREERVGNVEMQLMCFYLPSKYQEHSHPHGEDHHDHDGDHSHDHNEGHSHSHNEDHSHDTKPHSHGDDTKPHSHEENNHSHSHGDDTKPHDDNHSHSHGDDTKPHNEDHTHPHGDDTKPHYEDHDHSHDTKPMDDSIKPAGRHAARSPPLPMEGSRVVLYNRPALDVYVRQFGGWALTAATWEQHRQQLLDDLLGKRVKRGEFYTASYNSPMEMKNRRNEVMVQADPELAEIPQAFLLEQLMEAEQEEQEQEQEQEQEEQEQEE